MSFNLAIQQAKGETHLPPTTFFEFYSSHTTATPSQHSPPDEKGQHQKDRPIELPPISTLSAPGTSLSSSNANAFQSDISPILAHRTVTPQIPPVIQPTGQGNRQPTFPRQNSESSPQLESSNHTFRANTSSSVVCPVRALPVPVTNRPFPPPHFPPPNRPLPLPPSPSGTKTSVSNHPTIDNVEEEASLFLRSIIPSAYRHYTPTEGLPTVEQSLLVSARDYIEDLEDVARQGVNGTRPEGFGEKGEYLREWDFRGKMGAMKRRRRE